jgi:hypothetical protein
MTTIDVVIIIGLVLFVNVVAVFAGMVGLVEIGRRTMIRLQTASEAKVVECQRMCVTLKNNEGEFIGLCTEMSSKRWTFEQAVTVPNTRGEQGEPIDGTLHVPPGNILFHQILTEVHNATDA